MNRVLHFLVSVLLIMSKSGASGFQGAPQASASSPGGWILISSLLIHRVITADFDYDQHQDNVSLHFDGKEYRIEVQISSKPRIASLPFHCDRGGVGLLATDVDGDQDRDLVIVNWGSVLPLAVWLNDGKGNFEKRDFSSQARFLANESPSSIQHANWGCPAVLNSDKGERFPFTKSGTRATTPLFHPIWMICGEAGTRITSISPSGPLLRSPPLLPALNRFPV